jgi:hypothetical protein
VVAKKSLNVTIKVADTYSVMRNYSETKKRPDTLVAALGAARQEATIEGDFDTAELELAAKMAELADKMAMIFKAEGARKPSDGRKWM